MMFNSNNPLYRDYERYRLEWMLHEGIYLDQLIENLGNAAGGYDFRSYGNYHNDPYVMMQDLWSDFNHNDNERGFRIPRGELGFGAVNFGWLTLKDYLEDLWAEFGDVSISDDEKICVDWKEYPSGCNREDVWRDFDELYAPWGGVAALMYADCRLEPAYADVDYRSLNSERSWCWLDFYNLTKDIKAAKVLIDSLNHGEHAKEDPYYVIEELVNDGVLAMDEVG